MEEGVWEICISYGGFIIRRLKTTKKFKIVDREEMFFKLQRFEEKYGFHPNSLASIVQNEHFFEKRALRGTFSRMLEEVTAKSKNMEGDYMEIYRELVNNIEEASEEDIYGVSLDDIPF